MAIPQMLNVYRHDRTNRALVTLAGEIDLDSALLVRESLEQCLREGIRTIDVDLTAVTFCDCSGLNAFLAASQHTTAAGGTLRLHHPPTTLTRLLALTGTGSLLLDLPDGLIGSAPAAQPSPSGRAVPGLAPVAPAVSGGVL